MAMTPRERAEPSSDDIESFLDDIYDTNIDGRPEVVRAYFAKFIAEHVCALLADEALALALVHAQAEDEGLWFVAQYATEAHLQSALRELHAAVDRDAEDRAALRRKAGV